MKPMTTKPTATVDRMTRASSQRRWRWVVCKAMAWAALPLSVPEGEWRPLPAVMVTTSAQPHLLPDFTHGCLCQRPKALRPLLEDRRDLLPVRDQLEVALPGRRVVGDDPIAEQLLHVDAARPRGPLAL